MSDKPDNVNLAYIGHAIDRLTTEVAILREGVIVLMGKLTNIESDLNALLRDVREGAP